MQGHTYHWKHGWIPLDHAAAVQKFGSSAAAKRHGFSGQAPNPPSVSSGSRQGSAPAPVPKTSAPDPLQVQTGLRNAEINREQLDGRGGRYNKRGNYNEAKGWNSQRGRSLTQYTEMGHQGMNLALRDPEAFRKEHGDDPDYMEIVDQANADLDELFKHNKTEFPMTVARGVTNDVGHLTAGDYFSDPAFLSTTTKIDQAQEFRDGYSYRADLPQTSKAGGWTFVMKIPAGTPALPGADYQHEIVLNRGVKHRVTHVDHAARTVYTELEN